MAETYLDQLVDYPAKIIKRIAEDKYCVGLLVNKAFANVSEDDSDKVLDDQIFDYQYVDETTQETTAYVWVEMEVYSVPNSQVKNSKFYITVACHKNYMKLSGAVFKGVVGNRRDNLVRFIDRLLNGSNFLGIGKLKLQSIRTVTPTNGFVLREITYVAPDFNIVGLSQ